MNMPYKGERLSMIIVLPAEGKTLVDMEKSLQKIPDINQVLKFGARKIKVEVSLPKFKLESQIELNEPLMELGMKDMFDQEKADFSGIILLYFSIYFFGFSICAIYVNIHKTK